MASSERTKPETYSADEPVGIAAVSKAELPGPLPSERWQYIPERLWMRLLHLGEGYELHFAKVMDPVVDAVLDSAQCESLEEELSFLASIVDDDALKSAIDVVLGQVTLVRGRSDMALVISPP